MQISALIIGFILMGAALVFVSRPFWEKQKKGAKDFAIHVSRRELVLAALRDLDFDFKTGKVSEEDYQPLRAQLLAEAAQYIESAKNEDEKLEALIQARRKGQQKIKCEHCGAPMEADQKFCSKCGTVTKTEACPSCGKKIRSGDLFCSSCGTKIEVRLETTA
jgi:predicted nucleic acid-binding Zn ribbon protein